MPKKIILIIMALFLVVNFSACDSTDSEPEAQRKECNLSAEALLIAPTYDVTYTAENTGDGTITKLTYIDNSGTKTIENPTLPWSLTVTITEVNLIAKITAEGSTLNGSLTVKINGTKNGSTFSALDNCASSVQ